MGPKGEPTEYDLGQDGSHIANLYLHGTHIEPGCPLPIRLDFNNAETKCSSVQASFNMVETVAARYLAKWRATPCHIACSSTVTEDVSGLKSGGLLLPIAELPQGCGNGMLSLEWSLRIELFLEEKGGSLDFELPITAESRLEHNWSSEKWSHHELDLQSLYNY